MKYYANCPVCAHKLMKGANGTQADIRCERCKNLVSIRIEDGTVTVGLVDEEKEISQSMERHCPV